MRTGNYGKDEVPSKKLGISPLCSLCPLWFTHPQS
jgi:hypothetical protein